MGFSGRKVGGDRDSVATAIHKTREEIGYTIDASKLQFFRSYHWNRDDLDLTFDVYKLTIRKGETRLEINKDGHTEYKWETPQNLYRQKDLMTGLYSILKDLYERKNRRRRLSISASNGSRIIRAGLETNFFRLSLVATRAVNIFS